MHTLRHSLMSTFCLAAVAGASLTSCSIFHRTAKEAAEPESAPAADARDVSTARFAALLPGDWQVIEVGGERVVTTPDGGEAPYVSFSPQGPEGSGRLLCAAFNGCNFTNVTVQLNGTSIAREGQPASTLRLCPDAPYEMAMTTALTAMASLEIAERPNGATYLYVKNGAGRTVMTLGRNAANFLDGAWTATHLAGLPVPKDVSMRIVISIADGSLHGQAACNTIRGRVTPAEGDLSAPDALVTFSNIAATRMMCPQIELERAFIGALEQTVAVRAEDDDNKAVFKDASGKTLLEMRRLSRAELEQAEVGQE